MRKNYMAIAMIVPSLVAILPTTSVCAAEIGSSSGAGERSINVTNSNSDYIPVYDYDLRDYEDKYIDDHNLSRSTYNANLADMIEKQMLADRAANINEGWHSKGGKYYFLKKGIPITGWYKNGVSWYYFNENGSMYTGWLKYNGDWYYFYDSGAMAKNVCVNGYYLDNHGAMTSNIPANAPKGISYQELINRVRNIGYSHKRRYEAYSVGEKHYAAGYEFFWYTNKYVDPLSIMSIRDDNTLSFSATYTDDDPDFAKDVYTILGWLFPTQEKELYNKINAKAGQAQTIYADGRLVDITYFDGGINFNIKDQ